FQLSPTVNDIARSLSAAVGAHVTPKKVVMLNENTDAGRDFSRISREWLAANARGVEVVADEFVDRGVTDLTPQLAKGKRLGAQAIIGEIYGPSGPGLFTPRFELRVPAVVAHRGATVSAQTFVDPYARRGPSHAHPDRDRADPGRQKSADLSGFGRLGRRRQVRARAAVRVGKEVTQPARLAVSELTKRFGGLRAVSGCSFEVEAGSVV